jgi:hypothetical protein
MLRRLIRFLLQRESSPAVPNYNLVMFKSYEQSLPDEPRCSIYKNSKIAA